MKKKSTLDELSQSSLILNDNEKNRIKGGTSSDDLLNALFSNIFVFKDPHLTSQSVDMFKHEVTDLAGTDAGRSLLQGLVDAKHQIFITNDTPPVNNQSVLAFYERSGNTLGIGALSSNFSENYVNNSDFSLIAHELYHAYQDNYIYANISNKTSTDSANDVKSELDAGIFSYLAAAQYDIKNNIAINDDKSHIRGGSSLLPGSTETASQKKFTDTWNDMFFNANLTISNYNTLIQNFKEGSSYKSSSVTYNTVGDFDYTSIDEFFYAGFQRDAVLLKAMFDNLTSTPQEILLANSNLRDTPVTNPGGGDSGTPIGGSGGGGLPFPWFGDDPDYGNNSGSYDIYDGLPYEMGSWH